MVENKGGAGGNLGSAQVLKAEPDGHTILMGTVATHALNPAIYKKMPYDAVADFAPAGTPPEVVDQSNEAALAALADRENAAKLQDLSVTVVGSSPEELAAHGQAELTKWAPVVKASGAQLD